MHSYRVSTLFYLQSLPVEINTYILDTESMKEVDIMKTFLSALQWALFILAGSLIVPISVATSYGLDGAEAIAFVQRTLFVLGFAGLLQAIFGHKLPIQEGPCTLVGIFSLYASLGVVLFGSSNETLKVLQYAFLLSGIICIILSVFGLIDKLVRYFTPTVIGTYLFLLVAQLSGSFLKECFTLMENIQKYNLTYLFFHSLLFYYPFSS